MNLFFIFLITTTITKVRFSKELLAECFFSPSHHSGINGYIKIKQESSDSDALFDTTIYGTVEIDDIFIHNNPDYTEECKNIGQRKYILQYEEGSKQGKDNIISLKGRIPGLNLHDKDFSRLSCALYCRRSNIIDYHDLNKEGKVIVGACGILQIYNQSFSFYMGLLIFTTNFILIIRYFIRIGLFSYVNHNKKS